MTQLINPKDGSIIEVDEKDAKTLRNRGFKDHKQNKLISQEAIEKDVGIKDSDPSKVVFNVDGTYKSIDANVYNKDKASFQELGFTPVSPKEKEEFLQFERQKQQPVQRVKQFHQAFLSGALKGGTADFGLETPGRMLQFLGFKETGGELKKLLKSFSTEDNEKIQRYREFLKSEYPRADAIGDFTGSSGMLGVTLSGLLARGISKGAYEGLKGWFKLKGQEAGITSTYSLVREMGEKDISTTEGLTIMGLTAIADMFISTGFTAFAKAGRGIKNQIGLSDAFRRSELQLRQYKDKEGIGRFLSKEELRQMYDLMDATSPGAGSSYAKQFGKKGSSELARSFKEYVLPVFDKVKKEQGLDDILDIDTSDLHTAFEGKLGEYSSGLARIRESVKNYYKKPTKKLRKDQIEGKPSDKKITEQDVFIRRDQFKTELESKIKKIMGERVDLTGDIKALQYQAYGRTGILSVDKMPKAFRKKISKAEKELVILKNKYNRELSRFQDDYGKNYIVRRPKGFYAKLQADAKGKVEAKLEEIKTYKSELKKAEKKEARVPEYVAFRDIEKMKDYVGKRWAQAVPQSGGAEAFAAEKNRALYSILTQYEEEIMEKTLSKDQYKQFLKDKEGYHNAKIWTDLLGDEGFKRNVLGIVPGEGRSFLQSHPGLYTAMAIAYKAGMDPITAGLLSLGYVDVSQHMSNYIGRISNTPFKRSFGKKLAYKLVDTADAIQSFGKKAGQHSAQNMKNAIPTAEQMNKQINPVSMLDRFLLRGAKETARFAKGASKQISLYFGRQGKEEKEDRSPQSIKPIEKVKKQIGVSPNAKTEDLIQIMRENLEDPDRMNKAIEPFDKNLRGDGADSVANDLHMNTLTLKQTLQSVLPKSDEFRALNPDEKAKYSKKKIKEFENNMVAFFNPIDSLTKVCQGDYSTAEIGILKAVYPDLWQKAMTDLIQGVRGLKKPLNNDQKMRLYRLTGFAVDPSVTNEFLFYNTQLTEMAKQREAQDDVQMNKKIDTMSKMNALKGSVEKGERWK